METKQSITSDNPLDDNVNPGLHAKTGFTLKYDHVPPLSMASSDKITILLADEDALRRDGLAAVLHGTPNFEVIAQCPDGEAALDQIRRLRPEVAVVDLNLPKLHGIELVRRVRGEVLGTKIVILAGTTDEDIIREVVRAGGDAYLLKNGPARHLVDAISYVRDGGQYFSPQLRRDGLDRHLLEEPPRVTAESLRRDAAKYSEEYSAGNDADDADDAGAAGEEDDAGRAPGRSARDSRAGKTRRSAGGRSDPMRFRERLREDTQTENLEERDYEILGMMAEGIRPILDRLDEIEGRIGDMETGEAPVPGNVRGWLNTQIADTFGDSRSSGRDVAAGRTLKDLEARLPQLIEQAVTARFHNMASKLQQEIEETHVRTLETFVKNIQVKLVQRVSALETDMSKQAEAMHQLREYSQRTEDNLSRLISGVDKLAQELPKRLAAPDPAPQQAAEPKPVRRKSSRSFSPKIFWIFVASIVLIVVAVFQAPKLFSRVKTADKSSNSGGSAPAGSAPGDAPSKLAAPAAGADTKTKLQAAEEYTQRKDYAMAEDLYKQVLKSEPNNVDVMKALASVLYRQDKIEESAAILDKLPRTN
jgi:DNA-binding NarL/FixJ family response regulator/cytochrome c-type biogenesis protein CcmH/NrfG